MCFLLAALAAPTVLSAVPTVRLADGRDMPQISMGTGGLGDPEASVKTALEVGFPAVDSALVYGNQPDVGRALATRPRESYWLTSKVPGCLGGLKVLPPFCHDQTRSAVELGLQRLNASYVDLMLLHTPAGSSLFLGCESSVTCGMMQNQWRALEEVKAAGLARSIGVSNYCPACLECLKKTAKEMPVVNQVEFHVGQGPDAQGFKSYCVENNITLMAYSPLGPWLGGSKDELIKGNLTTSIGAAHNRSSVQVALKWLTQRQVPIVVKSTKRENLQADLDLFSWSLSAEDLARLDKATTPHASLNSPSFMCKAPTATVVI